ncbi:uncharacterized protein LOC125028226 [Penaeus chinensis]|uniref:uncharacterized protein LOC125028226 n=1 Tax=Penaeus chinensis TaxID=139456 RepID=UPI001FB77B88|nr:uncharacterized protein LOC125028226 [Penaeus chinensis]XP_047473586.1 uncharacterized protein LOC125028226 [Penaeus chinensis]
MRPRALLLALLWGVHSARGSPSVYLVDDIFGNFLLVKGATLSETTFNISADSLCTCRTQCNALADCTAASLIDDVCRLSSSGLKVSTFTEHENATLMLWNTTQDGSFWLAGDGRLYLTVSGMLIAGDASATCSGFPGFRLGSFSSLESMAVLKEFFDRDGSMVSVDLSPRNVWGDGVPYNQANSLFNRVIASGYNFGIVNGDLTHGYRGTRVRLLCQADLANAEVP